MIYFVIVAAWLLIAGAGGLLLLSARMRRAGVLMIALSTGALLTAMIGAFAGAFVGAELGWATRDPDTLGALTTLGRAGGMFVGAVLGGLGAFVATSRAYGGPARVGI